MDKINSTRAENMEAFTRVIDIVRGTGHVTYNAYRNRIIIIIDLADFEIFQTN